MAALTIDQIAHALKQAAGNVSYAARGLGVARTTIWRHVVKSPTLQEVLNDAREELVDIAESGLRAKAARGNVTAMIWITKASPAAKKRGWGERQEVTGADGGPIETKTTVTVYLPDNGRDDRD